MPKPKKVVLVSAEWAPFHPKIRRICGEIARDKGLEFEERREDWVYLSRHGEKDELGGSDVPQVFIEYDDGTVVHALTKAPLTEEGKADFEEARRRILKMIETT